MAQTDVQRLLHRFEQLRTARSGFEAHWQDIAELINPHRGEFDRTGTPGERKPDVLDSTGIQAHRMLAAALMGMMTNPAQKWFGLRPRDPRLGSDERTGVWLEQCADMLLAVFNSPESGFKSQMHEIYLDLPAYGTAALHIEDRPGTGPLFSARPLREIYVGEDAQGRIDTVCRSFTLSARQARQAYGERAGAKVLQAASDPRLEETGFRFLHALLPRTEARGRFAAGADLPIASCWINVDERLLVRESGYHEPPLLTPRWEKGVGEVYGTGCGSTALADLKLLQRAMRATIVGAERAISPPLLVADDGVLGPVRLNGGGLTTVRADMMTGQHAPVRPLITGARPDLAEDFMEGIRGRVRAAFYYDLLRVMQDPRMTATQVLAIQEEVLRIMGPVLGRQETELLGPMIERVFAILLRAGALPPPPPALSGRELEVVYLSPIAKAQRASEAQSILRTLDFHLQTAASSGDTGLLDNLDLDRIGRRLGELLGMPKDLYRSEAEVAEIRRVRRQATAAAESLRALPALQRSPGGGNGGGDA